MVISTDSPPPMSCTLAEVVLDAMATVPDGWNALLAPVDKPCLLLSQPMCSIITARLKELFVAVGTVVGFVVVSDGAQKPPIQYQDCAMICCRRSIGSRVTMATPFTIVTMEFNGAISSAAIPAKSPSINAPAPQMIGRLIIRLGRVGCCCT